MLSRNDDKVSVDETFNIFEDMVELETKLPEDQSPLCKVNEPAPTTEVVEENPVKLKFDLQLKQLRSHLSLKK